MTGPVHPGSPEVTGSIDQWVQVGQLSHLIATLALGFVQTGSPRRAYFRVRSGDSQCRLFQVTGELYQATLILTPLDLNKTHLPLANLDCRSHGPLP